MKILTDIAYNTNYGIDGLGDLYLPDNLSAATKAALLIHGGGWSALDKSSLQGAALWLCTELNMAVYNINYRLCGRCPWPACGDDCLEAGNFLLNSQRSELSVFARSKILILGASAGGHLALMTGLRLPRERIAGIVSISGISEVNVDFTFDESRYRALFGHLPSAAELEEINPATYLGGAALPILCTHDLRDNVVPIECDNIFAEKAEKLEIKVETFAYEKPENGYSHRIWIPESNPRKMYADLETRIAAFINCIF